MYKTIGIFSLIILSLNLYSQERSTEKQSPFQKKEHHEYFLILIQGKVVCENSDDLKNVIISIKDYSTDPPTLSIYKPNKKTGEYFMILPSEKKYNMTITADSYQDYATEIHIPQQTTRYELHQHINLKSKTEKIIELVHNTPVDSTFKEQKNNQQLVKFIEQIIQNGDQEALGCLDLYLQNHQQDSGIIHYQHLTQIISRIIAEENLESLKDLESITAHNRHTANLTLYYPTNESQLSQNQKDSLNFICHKIKGHNKVYIKGYSDNSGSEYYKYNISKSRVEVVSNYLLQHNCLKESQIVEAVFSDTQINGLNPSLERKVEIEIEE